jgi:peptidoglycan hydrolase-like protein with peptidoglycan-binding domain
MADYQILRPPPHRHRVRWITLVVVVVAGVGVAAFAAGRHKASPSAAAGGRSETTTSTRPAVALTVASTTPATGAVDVASDQSVSLQFSVPVTPGSALPAFSPAVAGVWRRTTPTTLTFVAAAPFIPTATETLTIPAGLSGPRGTDGATLAAPVTLSFVVAQASTERLQQLLAQLGYLPLAFTPAAPVSAPAQTLTAQDGNFSWRWAALPDSLTSLWIEGAENVIAKGALMNFENQNGLTVDGLAGTKVWTALLADAAAHKVNANPYTYVSVSKQVPQNLTLYVNGAATLANVAVNTGAPGADTADGTFPVFEHVTSSRMQGTNPDGSTYDDPAVPWASYFNGGDALHGFVRATYGTPQSNGCVEMPVATAAQVWPLTPIGTLVTVAGPAS